MNISQTFFFVSSTYVQRNQHPQLINRELNGQFRRKLNFSKVPEEAQHFPMGGSNFFQGWGGLIDCSL